MDSEHRSRKKKRKGKSKKKKSNRSPCTSTNSESDEWVEAPPITFPTDKMVKKHDAKIREVPDTHVMNTDKGNDNDEWMSNPLVFSGLTRDQLKPKKEKVDDKRNLLDLPGQSNRELNPYWKDGGSGVPEEQKELKVTDSSIGDYGVEWLHRALRRSKEQAKEEGRSLEDVVAERWGSLEKLENMIKEAEAKSNKRKYNEKHDHYNKRKYDKFEDKFKSDKYKSYDDRHGSKKYYKDYDDDKNNINNRKSSIKERFKKPPSDDESEKRQSNDNKYLKKGFMRPSDDDFQSLYKQNSFASLSSTLSSSGRGWKKQKEDDRRPEEFKKKNEEKELKEFKDDAPKAKVEIKIDTSVIPLTANERNELAAKLIKAEMLGNTELVKKLKSQLEEARSVAADSNEVVVLTRTDSRGFTRPLSEPTDSEKGRKKKGKMETHEGGKRVRYFTDDDRYSLQEMFEREKCSTVEDQNAVFARLASKHVGRDGSAHDMDDVFDDMIRKKDSEGKAAEKERSKAIEEHKRTSKALDECQWCLEGRKLLKHLVVAVGSKVYLCLPPYESLTEGHCLLLPAQHVSCATQLDEDVWEEMQNFRSALVKMFLAEDLDIVFFECAMHFYHVPHMVLHCVPLPKESGDVAPVYFKKAIMECEQEWSSNKKLVDLAGKNVRRAVPRGLPYFAVDFGLQPGYAHVIEDEKVFPKNFAQEIIGGMLDVDHNLWRKPRMQKFEEQRKKVVEFIKMWKPFDFTKQDKNDE